MRNIDFSSWQSVLVTLIGLALFTLISIGIRLLMMVTIQQRRERMNRQINERLRTLIAAYKTLGGSFTGDLSVDPRHLRDLNRHAAGQSTGWRPATTMPVPTAAGAYAMRLRQRFQTSCCSGPTSRFGLPNAPLANWSRDTRSRHMNWWSRCAPSSARRSISAPSLPIWPSYRKARPARRVLPGKANLPAKAPDKGAAPAAVAWAWAEVAAGWLAAAWRQTPPTTRLRAAHEAESGGRQHAHGNAVPETSI